MSKSGSFNPRLSLKAANFECLHNLYSAQNRWEEKSFSAHSERVCLSLSRLKSPLQSWDLQRFCIPLFLRRSTPTLPGFWGPAEKDFTDPESSQFFLPRILNDFYLATEVKAEPQTHKGLAGQAFPIKSQALVRDTERHEILLSHNCVIIPAVSGGAAPPPTPENLCFAGAPVL